MKQTMAARAVGNDTTVTLQHQRQKSENIFLVREREMEQFAHICVLNYKRGELGGEHLFFTRIKSGNNTIVLELVNNYTF